MIEHGAKIVFWSVDPHAELLAHKSIKSAVEAVIDHLLYEQQYNDRPVPETIEVYGYARMDVGVNPARVLEQVLEDLDEEHADPSGEWQSSPTSAMAWAAERLCRIVEQQYQSWMCEQVERKTVRVADYVEDAGQ